MVVDSSSQSDWSQKLRAIEAGVCKALRAAITLLQDQISRDCGGCMFGAIVTDSMCRGSHMTKWRGRLHSNNKPLVWGFINSAEFWDATSWPTTYYDVEHSHVFTACNNSPRSSRRQLHAISHGRSLYKTECHAW